MLAMMDSLKRIAGSRDALERVGTKVADAFVNAFSADKFSRSWPAAEEDRQATANAAAIAAVRLIALRVEEGPQPQLPTQMIDNLGRVVSRLDLQVRY
jgi:hypothetical protein